MGQYIVLFIIVIIPVLVFFGMYNSLVVKRNAITNSFGAIDAVLKKRYDLIPNLVASAQAYMRHEQDTLTHITALRTQALNSSDMKETLSLNAQISEKIKSLMVSVENYPDLKSSDNMLQLQQTLTEVEGQLSAARRTYNQNVTNYNNACQTIPTNIIAAMFGHKTQDILETIETERANVSVQDMFQK